MKQDNPRIYHKLRFQKTLTTQVKLLEIEAEKAEVQFMKNLSLIYGMPRTTYPEMTANIVKIKSEAQKQTAEFLVNRIRAMSMTTA